MAKTTRGPAATMMTVRKVHGYLGMLIAPSVIFLALTGGLQLYHLHEAFPGYKPAPLIEKFGRVHKDQEFALHPERPKPPEAIGATKVKKPDDKGPAPSALALKAFFLVVSLALTTSTLLGVWIGLTQSRNRGLSIVLLLIGAAAPVLILALL
jgi:hypothetical protein